MPPEDDQQAVDRDMPAAMIPGDHQGREDGGHALLMTQHIGPSASFEARDRDDAQDADPLDEVADNLSHAEGPQDDCLEHDQFFIVKNFVASVGLPMLKKLHMTTIETRAGELAP